MTGRGRFLEHLLVATLQRAVALAEVDRAAFAVAEHLELDVARVGEIFLHVDGVVAERRARFRRGLAHQAFELVVGAATTFMPRPPPPDAALIRTG